MELLTPRSLLVRNPGRPFFVYPQRFKRARWPSFVWHKKRQRTGSAALERMSARTSVENRDAGAKYEPKERAEYKASNENATP